MRILYVCKHVPEFQGNLSSFNRELIENLEKLGVHIDLFLVKGNGIYAYVKNFFKIRKILHTDKYDIVHSIYVLTALLTCFQNKTPVISHYIGSDINVKWLRIISKYFTIKKSKRTIFVTDKLYDLAGKPQNGVIIPFGIDLSKFFPVEKSYFKNQPNSGATQKHILFSSRFNRKEKNAVLALKAIKGFEPSSIILKEFKNIPDDKINLWYNACEVVLMTSKNEGSPQFIKEAMACNCPIVSTDVGDVKYIFGNTDGCFISSFDPLDVTEKIKLALAFSKEYGKTKGRDRILSLGLDSKTTAEKVFGIYKEILMNNDSHAP